MKRLLLILIFALAVTATAEKTCVWNHEPPAEYSGPAGVGGYTIAYKFFEDVEGENTLGVDKDGIPYGVMVNARNSYEAYYYIRMAEISDIMDNLDTELSVATILLYLDMIHIKLGQIDTEYLDTILDIHDAMDAEDADLYDDYLILLGE